MFKRCRYCKTKAEWKGMCRKHYYADRYLKNKWTDLKEVVERTPEQRRRMGRLKI